LKIISPEGVELADETPSKMTAENYADYPLVILNQDGKQEVARLTVDANGNYHAELPSGDYVLQLFTIAAGRTVRVDMNIDTGVR
jgi:hypothetical protein